VARAAGVRSLIFRSVSITAVGVDRWVGVDRRGRHAFRRIPHCTAGALARVTGFSTTDGLSTKIHN
jgi:hypothetical protein